MRRIEVQIIGNLLWRVPNGNMRSKTEPKNFNNLRLPQNHLQFDLPSAACYKSKFCAGMGKFGSGPVRVHTGTNIRRGQAQHFP
jgi:hypothetical protein